MNQSSKLLVLNSKTVKKVIEKMPGRKNPKGEIYQRKKTSICEWHGFPEPCSVCQGREEQKELERENHD